MVSSLEIPVLTPPHGNLVLQTEISFIFFYIIFVRYFVTREKKVEHWSVSIPSEIKFSIFEGSSFRHIVSKGRFNLPFCKEAPQLRKQSIQGIQEVLDMKQTCYTRPSLPEAHISSKDCSETPSDKLHCLVEFQERGAT